MELINFDPPQEKASKKRHHWLLPDAHYLIVGPTGSGKTNLLLNMLTRWFEPGSLTIYTTTTEQGKYQMLADFYATVGMDDQFVLADPQDVVPVAELPVSDDPKLVVFDDIRLDSKSLAPIKEYFSAGRHRGVTAIYLAQSYYDVPKYIRRNAGCVILLRGLDQRDVREIAADHADGVTKQRLASAYGEATAEPYSFLTIDRTAREVPMRYRQNFDRLLMNV